jgi:aminoglycoside phosphotransferase (APT) family kinase protein
MLPSLGYVDELTQAADQGGSAVRSKVNADESVVERVVAKTFSNAGPVTVHEGSTAGDGGVTYTFTLKNSGSTYVVKFAPDDGRQLKKGASVYNHLTETDGIPVPQVYVVETDPSDIPSPYTVVEHIGGDELTSIPQFKSFSRESKCTLVREMGRILGRLHTETRYDAYGSISVDTDGSLSVDGETSDWTTYYREMYEEYVTKGEGSPVDELAQEALDFFNSAVVDIDPEDGPVLLHGDFTPDNLIIEDSRVQAVLDWEHATAGRHTKEAWEVEENVVNIFASEEVRSDLRDSLWAGYAETATVSDSFEAMKHLFAVGEFTKIGRIYSVLSNVVEVVDTDEFVSRSEQELSDRLQRAKASLK